MKNKIKNILIFVIIVLFLLLWAPWITNDYAIDKVIDKLGGPEASFDYLGQNMAIRDIPKEVSWFPFGKYVTFPSEAGWFVNFYGNVEYNMSRF